MMKTFYVSSELFETLAQRLLGEVRADGTRYDGVLCPLRGGYWLSRAMARGLGLPIYDIEISSYVEHERKSFTFGRRPDLADGTYLLCDDIYDSGNTINMIISLYPGSRFDVVCLVTKRDVGIRSGMAVEPDVWVEYFWEVGRA